MKLDDEMSGDKDRRHVKRECSERGKRGEINCVHMKKPSLSLISRLVFGSSYYEWRNIEAIKETNLYSFFSPSPLVDEEELAESALACRCSYTFLKIPRLAC